jgi:ELWxxDGT repeat protein
MLSQLHLSYAQPIQTNPVLVADLSGTIASEPREMIRIKPNQLIFFYTPSDGNKTIALLEGSSNTILPLKEFPVEFFDSHPVSLSGQRAVFIGYDTGTGYELWATDKTVTGTVPVKDINPGGNPAQIVFGPVLNNKVFFLAKESGNANAQRPFSLWITDGTANGTKKLADSVNYGNSSPTNKFINTIFKGSLYFYGYNPASKLTELWKSDGTASGTLRLLVLNSFKPEVGDLTVLNDALYFHGYDTSHGEELWISKGTFSSTTIVKDINPGVGSSSPANLTVFKSKVWFIAYNGTSNQIWYSKGNASNTNPLSIILQEAEDHIWGATTNALYFTNGFESWLTKGTNASSAPLTFNGTTYTPSYPEGFFEFNGGAYFSYPDYAYCFAMNNGTATGTYSVNSGLCGLGSPSIQHFSYQDILCYSGGDLQVLGITDGTSGKDYYSTYEYAFLLQQDDSIVYMNLFTDSLNSELWKLDLTKPITYNETCNQVDDNTNGVIDDIAYITNAQGTVSICTNSEANFTALWAESNFTFQWLKDGVPIAGAKSYQYSTTNEGNYSVVVHSGTCTDTSKEVKVNVLPVPAATIMPLGNLDICLSGSVTLKANPGTSLSYLWYKNNSSISSATNQTYTATTTGDYSVKVTGMNGCTKTSNELEVYKSCKTGNFISKVSSEVSIYPNPARTQLFITIAHEEFIQAQVTIYDHSGRKVMEKEISGEVNFIDISPLDNGMYFLDLKNEDVSFVRKFEVIR